MAHFTLNLPETSVSLARLKPQEDSMKWLAVVALTWIALPAFAADSAAPARKPSPAKAPEHFRGIDEVEGTIKAMDATAQALWLADSSDKQWQVRFTKDTQVTNKNNVYLGFADLKKGDLVHVYLNTSDNTARQVDVIGKKLLPSTK
jgi:hypothetical protein